MLGKCAWCVVFAFMPRGDAGISPAVLGYPAWVCVLPNLTKANPPIKKKRKKEIRAIMSSPYKPSAVFTRTGNITNTGGHIGNLRKINEGGKGNYE